MEFEKIPSEMYVGSKRNQKVDVAAGMRIAARKRAEYFQPGDAVTLAERNEPGLQFVQRRRNDIVMRNHIWLYLINIPQDRGFAEAKVGAGEAGRGVNAPFGVHNPSVNLTWTPAGHNEMWPWPQGRAPEGNSELIRASPTLRHKEQPCEYCMKHCCGLDIHNNKIVACVMVTDPKQGTVEARKKDLFPDGIRA